jgi:hypothetical protein
MSENRDIEDIFHFRSDISPFLVHLTRSISNEITAKNALKTIIEGKSIKCGKKPASDARLGTDTRNLNDTDKLKYFCAICFTETPLNEIHCLFDIAYRQVNLEPYGLVFLKDKLKGKGVSPVLYLNNEQNDKLGIIQALSSLIASHPSEASEILPLISSFGKKFKQDGDIDFLWEREWRYPYIKGSFTLTLDDIFIGLCPHGEIKEFEAFFKKTYKEDLGFIDPTRNMKWYATKLINARQRTGLKFSVV